MYDANNVYSEGVEYTLVHVGGDKYLLTVTASKEWIDAEERAFPVKVDPSVKSSGDPDDTYVIKNGLMKKEIFLQVCGLSIRASSK